MDLEEDTRVLIMKTKTIKESSNYLILSKRTKLLICRVLKAYPCYEIIAQSGETAIFGGESYPEREATASEEISFSV